MGSKSRRKGARMSESDSEWLRRWAAPNTEWTADAERFERIADRLEALERVAEAVPGLRQEVAAAARRGRKLGVSGIVRKLDAFDAPEGE